MRVAIAPGSDPRLDAAVTRGGAELSSPDGAEGLVWTDPSNPEALRALIERTNPRWVQLPFAGIERFVAAGVVDAARTWTCAKGIYGPSTAEHAVALVLVAARQLHAHARRASWWSDPATTHRRLAGTTALVVGTGGIGTCFAQMMAPHEVRILAANRSGTPAPWADRTVTDVMSVIGVADWVVLAAASTPETHHLINANALAAMKPDAWIVNVARGALVDTDALVDALREQRIGGAALDVTDPEPLPGGHPLWSLPNAIVTSHTANTIVMALPELAALVERNISAFVAGEPLEGLVDPKLGY